MSGMVPTTEHIRAFRLGAIMKRAPSTGDVPGIPDDAAADRAARVRAHTARVQADLARLGIVERERGTVVEIVQPSSTTLRRIEKKKREICKRLRRLQRKAPTIDQMRQELGEAAFRRPAPVRPDVPGQGVLF